MFVLDSVDVAIAVDVAVADFSPDDAVVTDACLVGVVACSADFPAAALEWCPTSGFEAPPTRRCPRALPALRLLSSALDASIRDAVAPEEPSCAHEKYSAPASKPTPPSTLEAHALRCVSQAPAPVFGSPAVELAWRRAAARAATLMGALAARSVCFEFEFEHMLMMEAAVIEAVVEVRGWRWRANLAAAKVARRIMERERSYLVRVYLVRIVLAACWYDRERCLRWKYIVLQSVLVIQKDTRRETCGGERIERSRKSNFERWRGRYLNKSNFGTSVVPSPQSTVGLYIQRGLVEIHRISTGFGFIWVTAWKYCRLGLLSQICPARSI